MSNKTVLIIKLTALGIISLIATIIVSLFFSGCVPDTPAPNPCRDRLIAEVKADPNNEDYEIAIEYLRTHK